MYKPNKKNKAEEKVFLARMVKDFGLYSAQEDFKNSLDVDANIVSLCPMCHCKLHHGNDIQQELLKLFINRVGLLKKSGIDISFEQLIKYYK